MKLLTNYSKKWLTSVCVYIEANRNYQCCSCKNDRFDYLLTIFKLRKGTDFSDITSPSDFKHFSLQIHHQLRVCMFQSMFMLSLPYASFNYFHQNLNQDPILDDLHHLLISLGNRTMFNCFNFRHNSQRLHPSWRSPMQGSWTSRPSSRAQQLSHDQGVNALSNGESDT